MIRTAIIISLLLFSAVSASASSAGEISLDSQGNPIPVNDPAISIQSPEIPEAAKKLPKKIVIDLSDQSLSYFYGNDYLVDQFKISSGLIRTPTPKGTFAVLSKIPVKAYAGLNTNGTPYYLPNTKWNLKFSNRGYYIHGAYWHNNFGRPMSHGCVNVSYSDMQKLYEFANVGTKIIIRQ